RCKQRHHLEPESSGSIGGNLHLFKKSNSSRLYRSRHLRRTDWPTASACPRIFWAGSNVSVRSADSSRRQSGGARLYRAKVCSQGSHRSRGVPFSRLPPVL